MPSHIWGPPGVFEVRQACSPLTRCWREESVREVRERSLFRLGMPVSKGVLQKIYR